MLRFSFSNCNLDELLAKATHKCTHIGVEEWEQKVWSFIVIWLTESNTHIPVTTSGSTGIPTSISHSKAAMRQSAMNTVQALGLTKNDVALLCLPANKIGGMMMIVRAILLGMDLICVKPSANPWEDIISQQNISFLACTPMQLSFAFKKDTHFLAAKKITNILLGGGPITNSMMPSLTCMNNSVYHTFGMTETISHIALKKISGNKPDYYYKTIGDTEINTDERQCLVIHSPSLNLNHLVTNDIVNIISAGTFEWLGRYDNVINTGGLKVYPEQLEEQISQKLADDFFIFGKPNELTGEKVCIAVSQSVDKTILRKAILSLPKNIQPKEAYLIQNFTYTETGKINRTSSLKNVLSVEQI